MFTIEHEIIQYIIYKSAITRMETIYWTLILNQNVKKKTTFNGSQIFRKYYSGNLLFSVRFFFNYINLFKSRYVLISHILAAFKDDRSILIKI